MAKRNVALMPRGARILVIALSALALNGCTVLDDTLASVPIFNFLRESPSIDPYEMPRPAPENAVPFASPLGATPEQPLEPTEAALVAWGDTVVNPVPMSEEVLAAGQEAYHTHCYVCHGADGEGNGPVVGPPERFPMGPSLLTPAATDRSDGYLYGIIRVGRGLMPAYGSRISHQERWSIVNYVRHLQQQGAAGEE